MLSLTMKCKKFNCIVVQAFVKAVSADYNRSRQHNFKLAEIDPLKDKAHGFQKYDNAALDFTPTVVCHRLHLPSVYN